MDNSLYFVGADIALKKFDVAIRLDGNRYKHKVFANTPEGFTAFHAWLQGFGSHFHILMEATNVYHEDLADYLLVQGLTVSVINPRCIPNFAKSTNMRSKTDKVDARLLADYAYCNAVRLRKYAPLATNYRTLKRLMRQLTHLKKIIAKEQVRIQMMMDALCVEISQEIIAGTKALAKELEKKIKELVKEDKVLSRNAQLLQSIPAVGWMSAMYLLSHLGDGSRFRNSKAAATYMGLTPIVKQSGDSLHIVSGISKMGPRDIRDVLYAPAMSYAFGPWKERVYAPFVQRLTANGKAPKEVIVALMRKLVSIAQAVLQHQRPFDSAILVGKAA